MSSPLLQMLGIEEIGTEAMSGLRCKQCGEVWGPSYVLPSGRLQRGWWKCPNGCNADISAFSKAIANWIGALQGHD
jgi:hypothetical protein